MRNLFNQLFAFRPKENFSAKENFLTEGFAHFLQRNKKVCEAFVKGVLGNYVEIEPDYEVTTRLVEPTPTGNCFPDLKVIFRTSKVLYPFHGRSHYAALGMMKTEVGVVRPNPSFPPSALELLSELGRMVCPIPEVPLRSIRQLPGSRRTLNPLRLRRTPCPKPPYILAPFVPVPIGRPRRAAGSFSLGRKRSGAPGMQKRRKSTERATVASHLVSVPKYALPLLQPFLMVLDS